MLWSSQYLGEDTNNVATGINTYTKGRIKIVHIVLCWKIVHNSKYECKIELWSKVYKVCIYSHPSVICLDDDDDSLTIDLIVEEEYINNIYVRSYSV